MKLLKSCGVIVTSGLLLTACVTTPTHLTIDSTPTGATVIFDDGRKCTTPCVIKATYKADITVAKAGHKAKKFKISAGAVGDYHVELDLISGTTEVETTSLPEL